VNRLLLILCLPFILPAATPGIYHLPPKQLLENTPFLVQIIADADFKLPDVVRVYYRIPNTSSYQEVQAQGSGYAYQAVIPVAAVTGDSLAYFIMADYGTSGLVALPRNRPRQVPYKIPILLLDDLINSGKLLKVVPDAQRKGHVSFLQSPQAQVQTTVTPWRVISTKYNSATIPAYYATTPDSAVECGMVRARGNSFAGYIELFAALLEAAKLQRADGFTDLRYAAYTERAPSGEMISRPAMEATYFSYGPTHQY